MTQAFARRGTRRHALQALLATAGLPLAAYAQDKRPTTIVVPFTPGTTPDVLARTLGPKLMQRLGQPVVVENRVGASGNIGTAYVANAAPDGHTLLMTASTITTNASLFRSMPYQPTRDFAPIVRPAYGALVLVVNSELPVKSARDAIELFKKSPGRYSYASPGNGTPQHLAMELFKLNTGVSLLHVPYKGSAGAITDLLGGQVQAMVLPVNTAIAQAKTGKIRLLAVTQEKRVPAIPEVPTMAEEGVKGSDVDLWFGFFAPAKTPPQVVQRLNAEVNAILAQPDVVDALEKQGLVVTPGSPEVLARLVQSETARWSNVIKTAGIQAD
jgi:tripartite-type tricarboxylate transporter receptor subunit TctC